MKLSKLTLIRGPLTCRLCDKSTHADLAPPSWMRLRWVTTRQPRQEATLVFCGIRCLIRWTNDMLVEKLVSKPAKPRVRCVGCNQLIHQDDGNRCSHCRVWICICCAYLVSSGPGTHVAHNRWDRRLAARAAFRRKEQADSQRTQPGGSAPPDGTL